jgi:hypothetical protein
MRTRILKSPALYLIRLAFGGFSMPDAGNANTPNCIHEN